MHESFSRVGEEQISDELRKQFSYTDYDGEDRMETVRYLPAGDLPGGSYIKTGYFLVKEVVAYERDEGWFEGFSSILSPQIYAAKLEKQVKFGPNKPKKDEFGEEYTEPDSSDYMFYAYPDYTCREYEAEVLRMFAESLQDYYLPDGAELVILETEG